jgi:SHAQKYF class myb-like DNA-binding protein
VNAWNEVEHFKFVEALQLFPNGPWKLVANYIGTKTPRQAMTHAQKYRQKIARRQRQRRLHNTKSKVEFPENIIAPVETKAHKTHRRTHSLPSFHVSSFNLNQVPVAKDDSILQLELHHLSDMNFSPLELDLNFNLLEPLEGDVASLDMMNPLEHGILCEIL